MNELVGQPAELRMTLTIKRAATGETETVDLVGRCTAEEAEAAGAIQVENQGD